MTAGAPQPLVVGVGNVFFSDDGFGVEVARRLAAAPPPGAAVAEFGIRAIHFAYELLAPRPLCIVADCMQRGESPGTLYVVEPAVDDVPRTGVADAHGMNLGLAFAAVRDLGGTLPRLLVVGCEPASIEPGLGLSAEVAASIAPALQLIRDLLTAHHHGGPS